MNREWFRSLAEKRPVCSTEGPMKLDYFFFYTEANIVCILILSVIM